MEVNVNVVIADDENGEPQIQSVDLDPVIVMGGDVILWTIKNSSKQLPFWVVIQNFQYVSGPTTLSPTPFGKPVAYGKELISGIEPLSIVSDKVTAPVDTKWSYTISISGEGGAIYSIDPFVVVSGGAEEPEK
jgi:hypothetical protein